MHAPLPRPTSGRRLAPAASTSSGPWRASAAAPAPPSSRASTPWTRPGAAPSGQGDETASAKRRRSQAGSRPPKQPLTTRSWLGRLLGRRRDEPDDKGIEADDGIEADSDSAADKTSPPPRPSTSAEPPSPQPDDELSPFGRLSTPEPPDAPAGGSDDEQPPQPTASAREPRRAAGWIDPWQADSRQGWLPWGNRLQSEKLKLQVDTSHDSDEGAS